MKKNKIIIKMFKNVFSAEDLHYFQNHPEVLAKSSDSGPFSIPVTDSIRASLSLLGLHVESQVPLRWMKGDTAPHKDVGEGHFESTYLVYLSDSPGEFIVDSQSHPIECNTGYVFNEGLLHETQNTGNSPRLMLGPMNERAEPVGAPVEGIHYYPTETDALTYSNEILYSVSYTVGSVGGFTSWRIAGNSVGTSLPNIVYNVGDVLDSPGTYNVYPNAPCFLEGSTVLCQIDGLEQYVPVEKLTLGTLVKTSLDGFKPVVLIGKGNIQNPGDGERTENRLYKCSPSHYPDLLQDLFITGSHSILEFPISEKQKEATVRHLGKLYVTDKKYRLMACVDERAEPWNSKGVYPIWHFALDNKDEGMNYGVYANGLLVETCSIRFLKNKSNLALNCS